MNNSDLRICPSCAGVLVSGTDRCLTCKKHWPKWKVTLFGDALPAVALIAGVIAIFVFAEAVGLL